MIATSEGGLEDVCGVGLPEGDAWVDLVGAGWGVEDVDGLDVWSWGG